MIRVLIPYGTTDGHTARIAEFLAEAIREQGSEAYPVDVKRYRASKPDCYDAVIVGASVHLGKHQRWVRAYVRENRLAFERLPSAFFSVSLAAKDATAKARGEATGYIEKFVTETGWRPGKVGLFAGALLYTRYGFFSRWLMQKIVRQTGSPDTDTGRDYVYTDWESVKRFGVEFLEDSFSKGYTAQAGWAGGRRAGLSAPSCNSLG